MTQTNSEEISARGRRTAVALFAVLAFAAGAALAVDKVAHENRADLRIKDMHAKLNITPAQEALWIENGHGVPEIRMPEIRMREADLWSDPVHSRR